MSSTLLIPLDGRPCNVLFPREMASLAGFSLCLPESGLLGTADKPARRDRLSAWLENRLEQTNRLFLSFDMWVYGNLVASRKNSEEKSSLLSRLQELTEIKQTHSELKIHAFATLLRISNSNDATEERAYWSEYGSQIYRFSWLEHYLQEFPDDLPCQAEYKKLKTLIPESILSNYQALRRRNFELLLSALDLVEDNIIETLFIGCDDSGKYGWAVLERQCLLSEIEQRSLQKRVMLYPGADELALALLGRTLVKNKPRLQVRWTYPESSGLTTRYEGIPLRDTLNYQAQACQVDLVDDTDSDYDAVLWMHNPPEEQIDQFLNRQDRVSNAEEKIRPLIEALHQSTPLLVADLMYANGGDKYLLERLEREALLFHPKVYAAWNTSGNTLGTVLSWYKLLGSGQVKEVLQQQFLIERITDDGWYQGIWRQEFSSHYIDQVNLNTCIQLIHQMNQKFKSWLTWMPNPPDCLQVKQLNFPWRRFFEIELNVCFKNQSDDLA